MSLYSRAAEVERLAACLRDDAGSQESTFCALVNGIVRLNQQYRVAKNYEVSDKLRALLDSVGVKVKQGTDGYAYDAIPTHLIGRPIGDSWYQERQAEVIAKE